MSDIPFRKTFTDDGGSLQSQELLGCQEFTGMKTNVLPDQIAWSGADSHIQGLRELKGFVKELEILQKG